MNEIISKLEKISEQTEQTFGKLSAEQLNWKPSAESWSVGQCFEHLIKANSAFSPEIDSIISGERKQNFWESYSPLSGFFGSLLIKSVSPQAERKLKAPKLAQPATREISSTIIEDFVKNQAEVIAKIKQTQSLDTKKIIVTSPFVKFITYSLFDGFRIIFAHEQRHFQQAECVMQTQGFPK